ncbi:MAG: methyl-accepting chemotaxis protein [Planctomycetaceae bacterium]
MSNLKLVTKMLVLTLSLLAVLLLVGVVAVGALEQFNDRFKQLVEETIERKSLASKVHLTILAGVRHQKNAVLSIEDSESQTEAAASDKQIALATQQLRTLEDHVARRSSAQANEGRTKESEELIGHLESDFKDLSALNAKALNLAVLNTVNKAWSKIHDEFAPLAQSLVQRLQSEHDALLKKGNLQPAEMARLGNLQTVSLSLLDLVVTASAHNANSDEKKWDNLELRFDALNDVIDKGLGDALGGDAARQGAARADLLVLRATLKKIKELSRIDSNNQSRMLSLGEVDQKAAECIEHLQKLDTLLDAGANADRTAMEQLYRRSWWLIVGVSLAGVVLGLGLGWFITRSVTEPVLRVRNLAQAMAGGDLRQRIGLKQSDEVGELAEATDNLAESLHRVVTEIQQVAGRVGDSAAGLAGVSQQLLSQSEGTAEQANLVAGAAEELSASIGTMAASAEQMSANVASISSASEEMSMNVGTISSAADQTSKNVEAVAAAVEEISRSFSTVLGNVRDGSRVAGEARRLADSATGTMSELNDSGHEISKVTETIRMIALQTNLLALNATIEATSAGEAGRGFAVVAQEIKELAQQSGRAAEDIARRIEGVQTDTRQAVEVIQQVSGIVQEINASAARVTSSVEDQSRAAGLISRNVSEASRGVGDIARSISEVAKAAGDMSRNVSEAARGAISVSHSVGEASKAASGISHSIHRVSEASRATTASANQVTASARGLDHINEELGRLVSRFVVREGATDRT